MIFSRHVHANTVRRCEYKKLVNSHKKAAPNIPYIDYKQRMVLGEMQIMQVTGSYMQQR